MVNPNLENKLREFTKHHLRKQGRTPTSLARQMGFDCGNMSRFMNGAKGKRMSLDMAAKILFGLGFDFAILNHINALPADTWLPVEERMGRLSVLSSPTL